MAFRTYLTLPFVLVALCGGVGNVFLNEIAGVILNNFISAQYASNLTGNPGCTSLRARQPDIAFVGDSHTYSGWRFNQVEEETGLRVGGCSVGGLFFETAPDIVSEIVALPKPPSNIVIGTSPRMFWVGIRPSQSKIEAQWTYVQKLLSDKAGLLIELQNALDSQVQGPKDFVQLEKKALSVSVDEIALYLEETQLNWPLLDMWRDRLSKSLRAELSNEIVDNICQATTDKNINLWLIHIPESPYLENLYSAQIWGDYVNVLKKFGACAQGVIVEKASRYGLTNQHFLEMGRYAKEVSQRAEVKTSSLRSGLVNLDHLNMAGAQLFTDRVFGQGSSSLIFPK